MDRRSAWVLGIIFGGLFLVLLGFLGMVYATIESSASGRTARSGSPGDVNVGVVEVLGEIVDSRKTVEQLDEFRTRDDIKAVIVRVDSPGGAVGPSQEIYDAILRLREEKKVVASMGSTAASGGYYISAAADKIYANAGTLTGSIGVIFQLPNVEGLMRWAGVKMTTLTAGDMKDSGSPFRTMTEPERELLEGMLADVHSQFIEAVASGRGLEVDQVKPYADGRVFSGRQAKEWKLVDELGGLDAAARGVLALAEIEGEPELVYPKKEKPLLIELLGEEPGVTLGSWLRDGVSGAAGSGGLMFRAPALLP